MAKLGLTGTINIDNEDLLSYGFLLVKDIWNVEELYHPNPPYYENREYMGMGMSDFQRIIPTQNFVVPAFENDKRTSRRNFPQYEKIHHQLRRKLEKILDKKLYPTYTLDHFYYSGQSVIKHRYDEATEISVIVNVSSSLPSDVDWPVNFEYMGRSSEKSVCLNTGDGVIFLGPEVHHSYDEMPWKEGKWFWQKKQRCYSHQITFNYVLQDGRRCECAYGQSKPYSFLDRKV